MTAPAARIDEARSALPAVQQLLAPAREQHRLAILFALADVMGKPDVLRDGSEGAQTTFWKAYHSDLAHLPAAVLSRACGAHRRSGERWFPTPGQLLIYARADGQWRDEARVAKGLERLAAAKPEARESHLGTPEQEAELAGRMERLMGKWGGNHPREEEAEDRAALDWFKPGAARPWHESAFKEAAE